MSYQTDKYAELNIKSSELIKEMPVFAAKFFNHLRDAGMSPNTKLQYAYDLRRFFEYLEESAAFKNSSFKSLTAADVLDNLNIDDIQEYFNTLEYYTVKDDKGKEVKKLASPAMKARRVSSLRSFYRYYFKIGEIKNNIADLMEVPKIPDKKIVVMDKSQVARILKAVTDIGELTGIDLQRHKRIEKRDMAIMILFFGTGIRVSELVGLDVSDVDFYNGSILVTRKGGDEDEVYFGNEVENALLDYIENCRDSLLGDNAKEDALFMSTHHKRISVRSVQLLIKGYADKAGLNMKVTPHALRRTFGTNLYEETGDIYLVADALHHSSVETTKKHYAKMSNEHKRIAAKKASTLFKEK